ncbi:MAG: glycoside hydrolase family 3 C-terminal domain-containing protein [Verrucomicrobia bacterium]|nr:glycoside hydrolase family 3 C-terminal domain-containing protein [Verrucomicrobiota bacterium]MCH8527844.1 glycoside hydrolase family 3 C-terminal domain-containing protein [Kiritimatiellia bacterium]
MSNPKNSPLPYRDAALPVSERVEDLLSRMSVEEKIEQLRSQMLFDPESSKRDPAVGHVRSLTHFAHQKGHRRTPGECAAINNADIKRSTGANRWGIPVLVHEEALHGAQWGDATCFPQSIALAATWDDALMRRVARAIACELKAVNIHQVLSPVVNLGRDSRWGRTQETYGEDVYLVSRMALAYVQTLEEMNIITTPKHFVDNYGEGGRDSNVSNSSWRVLREVFLEPFRVCVQEGRARSIMPAYNSVDGVPCTCSQTLLTDILRTEWGFEGFTVSDYGAVPGLVAPQRVAADRVEAVARSMEAGLDVVLPNNDGEAQRQLAREGRFSMEVLDRSVRRILKAKFELGLFEHPYVDAGAADAGVRSSGHRALALEAARKAVVLLKNRDRILPLSGAAGKIGVFGPACNTVNLGGYSGPYGGWKGEAMTPLEALRNLAPAGAEIRACDGTADLESVARECDVAVYFATIREDEGSDRSSLDLPDLSAGKQAEIADAAHAVIVDKREKSVASGDQESEILRIAETGIPVIVVLVAGSAVTMRRWEEKAAAIVLPWYGGEQGATAVAEVLFGHWNPGGRLPLTFPKTVGQCPLYYSHKPTGRAYHYNDNDGKPQFPFGFGLSYSTFEYSNLVVAPGTAAIGTPVTVTVEIRNTSDVAGDEVVQLYVHDCVASVAVPVKQLCGFERIHLAPGETRLVRFTLDDRHLALWNAQMKRVVEPGDFEIMAGSSSEDIRLKAMLTLFTGGQAFQPDTAERQSDRRSGFPA